jgi:uncharacterized protein (TIGR03437 family)
VGATITLNGRNFNTISGNNKVEVDGYAAPVLSATATQLKFLIPWVPIGTWTGSWREVAVRVENVTTHSAATTLMKVQA